MEKAIFPVYPKVPFHQDLLTKKLREIIRKALDLHVEGCYNICGGSEESCYETKDNE